MIAFVVYNKETGAPIYRAADPFGAVAQTPNLPENQAAMDIPFEAIIDEQTYDYEPIRRILNAKIDYEAEMARMSYLTAGSGQTLVYAYKGDEARRWKEDNTAETPFLSAEAAARGITLETLVNDVLASIGVWTILGARIEAAKAKGKTLLKAATNFKEFAEASEIDWDKEMKNDG